LLIGATGRNVGKTQLACDIIRSVASERPVAAVKITAAEPHADRCARGGDGCGACRTLAGDFFIEQEDGRHRDKDTARLLAAGADPCFWVRAKRAHLGSALSSLLDQLDPALPIICESTSLRSVVVPGVFLLVSPGRTPAGKPAAVRVWDDADQHVLWDGQSAAFNLEDLCFDARTARWCLRRPATAIILAGGSSTRMGHDKALLSLDGQSLLDTIVAELRPHFADVLISARGPKDGYPAGVRVIGDRQPGEGPLAALASALAASEHDINFVRACDIPDMNTDLVCRMLRLARGADIVVPRAGDRPEPLYAVYRKSVLPATDAALAAGERRAGAIFERCRTLFVDLAPDEVPVNLNTSADLEAYLARRRRRSA
jgi:molybdopterin-guanine dinucleotide biosynthesis protein A